MTTLIVIAGDSNAVGFAMSADTLPGYLASPNPKAYIFGGTFWGAIQPSVNTGTVNQPGAWSIEAQIAYRFGLDHPGETLLIVKSAKGSTPLAQDPAAMDWSPGSDGEMFDLTDARIDAAKAAYEDATGREAPDVSAVFFVGGPNDAFDPVKAASYGVNLADEFAAIRSEWMEDPNGYIGFSRMTDDASVMPYNFPVRLAQWELDQADLNAESVKTIGLGLQADNIHWDAAGIIGTANALYDNWIS